MLFFNSVVSLCACEQAPGALRLVSAAARWCRACVGPVSGAGAGAASPNAAPASSHLRPHTVAWAGTVAPLGLPFSKHPPDFF